MSADGLFAAFFGIYPEPAVMACDELAVVPHDLLHRPLIPEPTKPQQRQLQEQQQSSNAMDRKRGSMGQSRSGSVPPPTAVDITPTMYVQYNMKERVRQAMFLSLLDKRQLIISQGNLMARWKNRLEMDPDAPLVPWDTMSRARSATGAPILVQPWNLQALEDYVNSMPPPATRRHSPESQRPSRAGLSPIIPGQSPVDRGLVPLHGVAKKPAPPSYNSSFYTRAPPAQAPLCKNRTAPALKREYEYLCESALALEAFIRDARAPALLRPHPPRGAASPTSGGNRQIRTHHSGSQDLSGSGLVNLNGGTISPSGSSVGNAKKSTAQRQVEVLIRNTMLNIASQAVGDEKHKLLTAPSMDGEVDAQGRSVSPGHGSPSRLGGATPGMAARATMGTPATARELTSRYKFDRHMQEVRTREYEEKEQWVDTRIRKLHNSKKDKYAIPNELRKLRHEFASEKREKNEKLADRKLTKLVEKSGEKQRVATEGHQRRQASARLSRLTHDHLGMLRRSLGNELRTMRQTNDWGVPSVVKDTFGSAIE